MRSASLCSGIEAASVAWEPLGWQPAWFAEIEPFPSAVLAHHWPHIPNHGDMTLLVGKILSGVVEAPDILVGGAPCQASAMPPATASRVRSSGAGARRGVMSKGLARRVLPFHGVTVPICFLPARLRFRSRFSGD